MITVRVPATSANMGAGFDSLGIALSLYNIVRVEEIPSGIVIDILDKENQHLSRDKNNLVYRAMSRVFDKTGYTPSGIHLQLENNIKNARGMGSSSAAIAGGLVAANVLSGEKLTRDELIEFAVDLEGHPDNVVSALLGGFNVAVSGRDGTSYVHHHMPNDLIFAAFVPKFQLRTVKSRSVLPKYVAFSDAVYNEARSALFVASIITGKYENIRLAVGDRIHQRYRQRLIPHMDSIFRMCYSHGALGVYLSGAGPTIMAIIHSKNTDFESKISKALSRKPGLNEWTLSLLRPDNEGAVTLSDGLYI